jgi:carbon-monoxide dehydrogenase large subunit
LRRTPIIRRPSPAIANAVVDALRHLGVTYIDIPITPEKVWQLLKAEGAAE